jgi:hypothetical protein
MPDALNGIGTTKFAWNALNSGSSMIRMFVFLSLLFARLTIVLMEIA